MPLELTAEEPFTIVLLPGYLLLRLLLNFIDKTQNLKDGILIIKIFCPTT